MIILKINGRFGNQLFIYAYGQALAERHHEKVIYDFYGLKGNASYWDSAKACVRSCLQKVRATNSLSDLKLAVSELSFFRHWYCLLRSHYVSEKRQAGVDNSARVDEAIAKHNIVYLDGYWQHQSYFCSVQDSFKAHVRARLTELLANQRSDFQSERAVCVHVRRGDYVQNPLTAAMLNICDLPYFYRAMEKIEERIGKGWTYYIFSDDIDWCKKNMFCGQRKVVFVEGNGGTTQADFARMTTGHHFIISNSSYSWWAAWLGDYPDKVVVCPQKWTNNETEYIAPQCPEWMQITCLSGC